MKKIILVLVILVLAVSVQAAPFLVCDVDSNTTSYVLVFNNGTEIETPAPLHYDLSGIDVGEYVVEVKAKNVWGVSSAVPFEFIKALPQSVTGMGLSSE